MAGEEHEAGVRILGGELLHVGGDFFEQGVHLQAAVFLVLLAGDLLLAIVVDDLVNAFRRCGWDTLVEIAAGREEKIVADMHHVDIINMRRTRQLTSHHPHHVADRLVCVDGAPLAHHLRRELLVRVGHLVNVRPDRDALALLTPRASPAQTALVGTLKRQLGNIKCGEEAVEEGDGTLECARFGCAADLDLLFHVVLVVVEEGIEVALVQELTVSNVLCSANGSQITRIASLFL